MLIADVPGAEQRIVMHGTARVTPKYTVEITLYDFDGTYPTECVWDPHLPSPTKMKKLSRKIDAALERFLLKALQVGGLIEESEA